MSRTAATSNARLRVADEFVGMIVGVQLVHGHVGVVWPTQVQGTVAVREVGSAIREAILTV